jgi:hypothetical protein
MWREILYEAFAYSVQYLQRTDESLTMNLMPSIVYIKAIVRKD